MKTVRRFRIVSNGRNYRVQVFRRTWFGLGRARWCRILAASQPNYPRALTLMHDLVAWDRARVYGYVPVDAPTKPDFTPPGQGSSS